jgi:rod shape determining protein RodA
MQNDFVRIKEIKILEILLISLLISLIGIYIIVSNSSDKSISLQFHFLLATGIIATLPFLSFSLIQRSAYTLYATTIVFLCLVLVIGHKVGGATRWVSLYDFRFQPSELLKLVLPLTLIHYYHSKKLPLSSKYIFFSIFVITIPLLLVLVQPNLGTSLIILSTSVFVPFMLGLSKRTIRITLVLLLILLPLLWDFLFPYQQLRILAYLSPSKYSESVYQVQQSILVIQKGGFWGVNDLVLTVPEGSTDFAFSIFAYRFGLFGVMFLFFLFHRLIKNIIYLARMCRNPFLLALAASYAYLIVCSLMINVFMVTGLFPVVGVPMPFISYGGTAFLVNVSIVTILVAGFKKNVSYPIDITSVDFRKRQYRRLNQLSLFSNLVLLSVVLRLFYLYLLSS